MVAREAPAKAAKLVEAMYTHEGLDVIDRLHIVGEVMVENSDAFASHCCFGFENIPLDRLIHEPRTLHRLTERPMSLATFLARLYV